jgi:hypothetical protein
MKTFTMPPVWDSRKFATRYNLDFNKDFYIDGDRKLVVFPDLPDDPPIMEAPDPVTPKKTIEEELMEIKQRLADLESK